MDLATAVALGGDCLADIAVLRAQPDLACPVARTRWSPGPSAMPGPDLGSSE